MVDIVKTVQDAAGLIRGKEKGLARSKWDKGSNKSTRPGTSTRRAKKKIASPTELRKQARAEMRAKGVSTDGRVQEQTTKMLRKGAKSYAEARSMAEYGMSKKTVPAKPSITKAMGVLGVKPKVAKPKSTKKNVKNAKRRVKKGKK